MENVMTLIAIVMIACAVIWFYIVLPADMATARNRSAFGWVCISLLFSPVLAIILLALLGEA